MYFVYIIQSVRTKRYYIGSTNNIDRRLEEHNSNKTKSLKGKSPFQIVYLEKYNNLKEARNREIKIKSYKGGRAFKKLLGNCRTPRHRRGGRGCVAAYAG